MIRTLRHGLSRIRHELVGYFRAPDQVFFTFLFPVLMYLLFATIFGNDPIVLPSGEEVSMEQYFLPGMLAMAVLLSGTQNLAIDVAVERLEGGLKRLGATPLSPASFFIGKLGQVLVTCLLQVALLLATAVAVFRVTLPTDPARWALFALLFIVGLACFSMLGLALSAVPRSARSASAVVIPIVLLPQFISGIYLTFSQLPEWLQQAAGQLPLKWLAQGFRAVFLPDAMRHAEPTGEWQIGVGIAVMSAWLVAGIVATALTFRWTRGRG